VFARPEYQWVERREPLQWLVTLWSRFRDWLALTQDMHPAGFKVLFFALLFVLIVLLTHIGYVIWRITRPTARAAADQGAARALRLADARAHLEQAEVLAREGRYAEALAHRFIAVVLELERARALAFHPSKTPAEYVGEARLDAAGRESLAELVARLYRHLFGAVPCDERSYREFGAAAQLVVHHVVPG